MSTYEAIIGLEIHAQLSTRTKIFCPCPTTFGSPPNSQTCPVCLGHPGALPVLNRAAVDLGLRAAAALGCEIRSRSVFARKNYFYPDLPKGYQISQYDEPLATGGAVEFEGRAGVESIGLIRLHLEEDAGKSMHEGLPDSDRFSYVDLNRSGVGLLEIVTRPELRDGEQVRRFLRRLRSILRYAGVCDGNMERGSLRCDANVSLRLRGDADFGTRTELKNLNSFRNVQRALDFEIARQTARLRGGLPVAQETVLWDERAGSTRPMRGKEQAEDYRYFPEPDLPPLEIDEARIAQARDELPELPGPRKSRLVRDYGLAPHEAELLTLEAPLADFYEAVARGSGDPKAAAGWVLNDLLRELRRARLDESAIPLPAEHLVEMIGMVASGAISTTAARHELFGEMFRTGRRPGELVRDKGLEQVSDEATLRELARSVLAAHPEQVARYREGKIGLLGYFVGRVMRESAGKADPVLVNMLVKEMLES